MDHAAFQRDRLREAATKLAKRVERTFFNASRGAAFHN